MAVKGETKGRILDAAELLFAEHGFNETSLRTITSKAGVNLASVNYHYGDKKTLIRAVLGRYLEQFVPVLIEELESLLSHDEITMEDVFHCIKRPLVQLDDFRPYGASNFMSLIGRGYTDVQGHLRWFIVTQYSDVLNLFTNAVCRANPSLDPETLFWRLHFTLGASVFTMASSTALRQIAENDFSRKVTTADLIDRLVPYLAAGVAAPIEQSLSLVSDEQTGTL
ncbi:TetR family transcriptional regulator [Photobacterium swingsii]|uniref:TetR/AcrR family transcriptional regulator n=1 Tax=Photobacterium swingsii TaxID=680026 RepID=A0A0J8V9A8_9GAMM|nr:TetR/AcrR family transcriptional regulator [Photobacterium swingsii]KMV29205.1 TetR family transcriptional regulator [Photobacterium swingsii]PSW23144.1 TetR/AcrR family transcriptional regulator [Photobacterium swingsii]